MAGNSYIRDSAVNDVVTVDGNGLVDHDESVCSSSPFWPKCFVEDCNKIETEDMCEAEMRYVGKKGVGEECIERVCHISKGMQNDDG